MKGKSVRRRKRNALAANTSNLHKATYGKASKWSALPDPPDSKDELISKRNKQVRELLSLMKEESRTDKKKSFRTAAVSSSLCDPPSQQDSPQQQESDSLPKKEEEWVGDPKEQQEKRHVVSKTKLKQKMRSAEKKRKKVKNLQVKEHEQATTGTCEKAKAFQVEHIPFGDVAPAPPRVHLKRRHWSGSDPVPPANSRFAQVLQKHLTAGEAPLQSTSSAVLDNVEQTRCSTIDSYRANKVNLSGPGPRATMASLKALVKAGS